MSVIAFNFTKISGQRKTGPMSNLNIKSSTMLKDLKETPVGNQKGLVFTFNHLINYNPEYANVTLEGEVVVLANEKDTKDALAAWKKDKHLSKEMTEQVMNTILNKVSIQSLIMTRDLNLPAPIKLPRIVMNEQPAPAKEAKKK